VLFVHVGKAHAGHCGVDRDLRIVHGQRAGRIDPHGFAMPAKAPREDAAALEALADAGVVPQVGRAMRAVKSAAQSSA